MGDGACTQGRWAALVCGAAQPLHTRPAPHENGGNGCAAQPKIAKDAVGGDEPGLAGSVVKDQLKLIYAPIMTPADLKTKAATVAIGDKRQLILRSLLAGQTQSKIRQAGFGAKSVTEASEALKMCETEASVEPARSYVERGGRVGAHHKKKPLCWQ